MDDTKLQDLKPTPKPKTPAEEAYDTLLQIADVLTAEAGFHAQPGTKVYEEYLKLAVQCRDAAKNLRAAK